MWNLWLQKKVPLILIVRWALVISGLHDLFRVRRPRERDPDLLLLSCLPSISVGIPNCPKWTWSRLRGDHTLFSIRHSHYPVCEEKQLVLRSLSRSQEPENKFTSQSRSRNYEYGTGSGYLRVHFFYQRLEKKCITKSHGCWRMQILVHDDEISYIFQSFLAFYFLKVHIPHSSKIKSHTEGTKQHKSDFFTIFAWWSGSLPLTNGSGSGTLFEWLWTCDVQVRKLLISGLQQEYGARLLKTLVTSAVLTVPVPCPHTLTRI